MEIRYTSRFEREYRKLSSIIKNEAKKKEIVFRSNPFDNRLKTHKLKGLLAGFWSFSISYNYRIIFMFKNKDIVEFYSVGNHDIYEK